MPSRGRYLQGALGDLVPCDITEIEIARRAFRYKGREQGQVSCCAHPAEESQAVLGEPVDAHRFTVLGAHERAAPLLGAQREGERSRHAAHEALERKLPDEQAVLDAGTIDLTRGSQKRDGDGQIEARAGLSQGAWRKVDNDFVARHLKPA